MFSGFTDETVQFFLDLKFHNYTDYFHEHHDRYIETVQKPFYELIESLSPMMLQIDPMVEIRPHKCLARIHRDTRFSKDKSPYRDHLWFLFRRQAEPREKSVFFFGEFGVDRLDWGFGIWGENRDVMDIFRRKFAANPEGIGALIDDMDLPKHHLALGGSRFKKMQIPPQIPNHLAGWYAAKELYVGKLDPLYHLSFSEELQKEMEKDFTAIAPLYHLIRGISDEA